jgi:protein-S-isoprenylcysteine O-methyltransferase Ste14
MLSVNQKAFAGMAQLIVVLALSLFLPAWSLAYIQAWIFLAAFTAPVLAITLWLAKKDPALLARRVDAGAVAEKDKIQKIIQLLAAMSFLAIFVLSATDHRHGWSVIPAWVVAAGDVLVISGLLIVFLTFRENSFASATIEIYAQQKIISTGPYSLIRHPMYTGAMVMLAGTPLALGSWWGLIPVMALMMVIVWRMLEEEAFLVKKLPDYGSYRVLVKYRLLPFVW